MHVVQFLVACLARLFASHRGRSPALAILLVAASIVGLQSAFAASANNLFINSTPIALGAVNQGGINNTGNVNEAGEPLDSAGSGNTPAWWVWHNASFTGWVVLSTNGSTFDTVLDVWTGATILTAAKVAFDDDYAPTGLQSLVAFYAIPQDYHFRVNAYSAGVGGPILMSLQTCPTATITATTNWNSEGSTTPVAYTVNLSSSLVDPVQFNFTALGTAPSSHYTLTPAATSGFTLAGGTTSQTISLASIYDGLVTGNLTVVPLLSSSTLSSYNGSPGTATFVSGLYGYAVVLLGAASSATCTIVDADSPYIYVNSAASGTNTGVSWGNAFTNLHSALQSAVNTNQIWVAQGTYATTAVGDTFQLVSGTALYGGFNGTESVLTQRNYFANKTTLNGVYGGGSSYHVVTAADNAIIDGFTITGGNASAAVTPFGGGLLAQGCSPQVHHCTFLNNAAQAGGGLFLSNPGATVPAVDTCYFVGNSTTGVAGGLYFTCAALPAAGINNCVFANNSSGDRGGGTFIFNATASTPFPLVANCTFYGNHAGTTGGGLYESTAQTGTTGQVANCIFWNETATTSQPSIGEANTSIQTTVASNCLFQDASLPAGLTSSGVNLFNVNPAFANTASLPGPDGIYGTADDGLALTVGSPAADSGTATGAPPVDIAGNGRPMGAGFDMGAYELPTIIYVGPGGLAGNPGVSWAAPTTLKHALAIAVTGNQIWVKQGTYALASLTDTFQLVANVPVYGGFNGTETVISQRNVSANQTILNGFFGSGNAYHVVTAVDNSTIDGFTIENGNANGATNPYGGGLIAYPSAAPAVRRCTFLNNTAQYGGAAIIYATGTVAPALDQCYFANNSAPNQGGAVYFYTNVNPVAGIDNCVFANNTAGTASIGGTGGGIYYGGTTSVPNLVNCTFTGNNATGPGATAGGAFTFCSTSNGPGALTNCIFWSNSATAAPISFGISGAAPTATCCLFQEATLPAGLANGGGNLLALNPNFANPGNLPGADGIYGTADDGLALTVGSPAADSGTASGAPLTDLIGNGRPQGAGFDMGAYELPTVIYVTPSGAGAQNGVSWANAATLKHALAIAVNGSQIWAQQGTYTTTAQVDAFQLVSGAPLYGGFIGTETALNQRHRLLNPSILSGNYGGGNSYHVVIGADLATLDGFTITGGNANVVAPGANSYGGGLFAFNSTMTVSGCTFTGNSAALGGGGAYIAASTAFAPLSVFDCYFVNNTCTSNTSIYGGGGLLISSGNRSSFPGAVTNCVFASNSTVSQAGYGGGGIDCAGFGNGTLMNCTFWNNNVTGGGQGGGMLVQGGSAGNSLKVTNCIFFANNALAGTSAGGAQANLGTVTASYSLFGSASLDGVFGDGGNNLINGNPQFNNTSSLAGPDGIYGTDDDGLVLSGISPLAVSPAVDSGTAGGAPLTDISGHGRPQGAGFDMGAYELGATIYVAAGGSGSGLSWGSPMSLATAMSVTGALNGNTIWVKAGTYSPGVLTSSTFTMTYGVQVYGGFNGTETTLGQRNVALNQTVLTGGGVNYHVVTGANNSRLDGFVITGGKAVGSGVDNGGGGLLCDSTSPTVWGCVFLNNSASSDGGAVYIHNSGASPAFKNCVFTGNTSSFNGGAIEIELNATANFTNCTFSGNTSSPNRGGAMECFSGCAVTLLNCVLWGDTQSEIFINNSPPVPQLTATACNLQGALPAGATDGGSNLYTDPQFVNTGTLSGANGTFFNGDDGLMLSGSSPALNAGSASGTSIDIIHSPRPLGTGIDIGAYETPYVTVTASIPSVAKPALSGTTASFGQFTFTRNGDTTVPMTLNVTIAGSAVAGTDYVPITTPIVIPVNQTSVTVPVNIIPTSQAANPVNVVLTLNPSVPGAPDGYGCLPASTATVTITNLNTAGVVIVPVGTFSPALQPNILYTNQTQAPSTATFTVQLNSKPTAGVTVNLASSNVGEGTVSPSTVSFTTANWNTPVTVTVSGVNDFIARSAPVPYSILTSGAISTDPFYARNITVLPSAPQASYPTGMPFVAQSGNNWQVKVDGAARTTASFTVSNAGGLATVVLNAPLPTTGDNVQIQYLGEETFAVDGSTVYPLVTTFPQVLDKANSWVVSVTTAGGTSVLPCNAYTISAVGGLGAVGLVSTAGVTSVLVQTDVAAAVNDNHNLKNVSVVPVGGVSVTEGGLTAHYTVVLTSQPNGGNVVINLASNLPNLFTNVGSLTFTPTFNQSVSGTTSGWNVPQTVTVSATRDFIIENAVGARTYPGQIIQTLSGTGTDYAGFAAPAVPVTITDVDIASVVFTPASGLQTSTAGTTTTFTVQLSSIPTVPVIVTLHSSNPGYGIINGGNSLALTFTPTTNQAVAVTTSGWNVPQTVTVTGGTLNNGAGPVPYFITMDAPSAGGDANYTAITANPTAVSLTNTDAAAAGVIIVQNGQLSVTKGGASKTFTVQLSKDPTTGTGGAPGDSVAVTFTAVSNLVSITPSTVVFTGSLPVGSPSAWSNPVTLTVNALADNIVVAKTQIDEIVYAVASNNTSYNNLTNQLSPIPVTVKDNGVPGLSITPTAGLVTTESGGVASFQVGLLSRPVIGTSVNATLTSSNLGVGILAQQFFSTGTTAATISFPGADNLSAVQPGMLVQIAGLGPNNGAITLVQSVNLGAGTVSVNPPLTAYAGVETVYIEPSTQFTGVSSDGSTVISFTGGPTLLNSIFEGQAVLVTGPLTLSSTVRYVDRVSNKVTLAAAVAAHGGETVYFSAGPLNLSWTSAGWQEVQNVSVIGVHNLQVNGDVGYSVLAAASDNGDPHYNTSANASASTTDFDFPIAYLTPFISANWSVTGTALPGFTIIGNPDNTTHVHFSAPVSGTVTLSYLPTALSYTESTALTDFDFAIPFVADNGPNWSVSEGGAVLSGYTITNNAGFAHLSFSGAVAPGTLTLTYLPTVSLTNLNIDSAGFVVSPPTATTIFPGGSPSTATFTIHLTSEPVAPVTVQIQSSNSAKGTVSPTSLTFSPSTPNGGLGWDQPQTVTVTAVASAIADGAVPFTITMLPAASADTNYNTLVAPAVNMVTVDPDSAGISISPASSQNPATTTLVTNPQHLPSPTTASFTVVLTSQPLANVTVPLSSSNPAKGVPSVSSLVFTPANWNVAQTVTVNGITNPIVQGTVPYQIVFAQPQTTDPSYAVLGVLPVNINGHDNNSAGYVFSDPNSLTGHIFAFPPVGADLNLLTTDLGGSAEFQVALTSQPSSGTVTINLSSTNTALGTPTPAILTFNAANWNQPQVVTVTGGNANNTDLDGTYQIVFSSVVGPVEYSGLTTFTFSSTTFPVAVPLTNVAQNKTPTLSPITNITVLETNVALASQPVQLVNLGGITTGQASEVNVLSVSAVSDNPSLIPNPVVTYNPGSLSPPPATGTLGFQQGVQQNGVANITVTVTSVDTSTPPPPYSSPNPWRGGTKTVSQVFAITVTPVNQQPTFSGGPTQTQLEQVGAQVVQQSLASWATAVSPGAINETSQQLTFLCTNDNNALFSVQPTITYVPPASGTTTTTLGTGTLTYTLASTAFGTANVTVVLMDNGGTANGGINASAPFIFQITVTTVNQPPTIAIGPNIQIQEGAAPQVFAGWATGIAAGPTDESGQALTITVANDNNALFSVQPVLSQAGNLTFTPNPQTFTAPLQAPARGIANVTVTLTDNGGTANGGQDTTTRNFTITINPTNAAPVVTISDPTSREVAIGAIQVITPGMLSATDIDSSMAVATADSGNTVRYPAADPNLIFTVTLVPGNGTLKNAAIALAVGDTFLQSDIVAGNISYTHNGGTSSNDGFAFTVTDEAVPAGWILATNAAPNLPTTALPAAVSPLQVFSILIDRSHPVVSLTPAGPLGFTDQGPPEIIAATATVSDTLSPSFQTTAATGSGLIVVSFASGGTLNDVIGIASGVFTITGTTLDYTGSPFGTINTVQGANGTVLTISSLTNLADAATVATLLQNLTFQNTAPSPSDPHTNPVTPRTVQVVVTDAFADSNALSPATLLINVTSLAHAPTFTSGTQLITAENVAISGIATAVSIDGYALTYALVGTPSLGTAVINSISGGYTFTPVPNTTGSGGFQVSATDPYGLTVTQTINVDITADNALEPFIASNPPMDTQQNNTVVYNVVGYSPGTATPTFTVVGLPGASYTISVSGQTATLTLLPAATATAGYVTFGILITDPTNSLSGFQPVTLLVEPTPAAGG